MQSTKYFIYLFQGGALLGWYFLSLLGLPLGPCLQSRRHVLVRSEVPLRVNNVLWYWWRGCGGAAGYTAGTRTS